MRVFAILLLGKHLISDSSYNKFQNMFAETKLVFTDTDSFFFYI